MMGCANTKPLIMLCFSTMETVDEPNPHEIDKSHFIMEGIIGQGGFGIVQKAVKISSFDRDRRYAVKVCLPKYSLAILFQN
jgi:hypothetical protein